MAHPFEPQELASKVGLLNTVLGLGTWTGPGAIYAIIPDTGDRLVVGVLVSGLFMLVGGSRMANTLTRLDVCQRADQRPED